MPSFQASELPNCQSAGVALCLGLPGSRLDGESRKAFEGYSIAHEATELALRLDTDLVFQRFPYSKNFSLAVELSLMDLP